MPWRGSSKPIEPAGSFGLRRLGSLDRGQRADVGRERLAVGRAELLKAADDLGHLAAEAVAVRRLTGLEQLDEILLRIGQALLRDVGHEAVGIAARIGSAGEALARDDAAQDIARRMAFGAMGRAVG